MLQYTYPLIRLLSTNTYSVMLSVDSYKYLIILHNALTVMLLSKPSESEHSPSLVKLGL